MGNWVLVRFVAFSFVIGAGFLAREGSAQADTSDTGLLAYDISWPQCPETFPQGDFEFAVIGLTNGKPFTTNPCFDRQYAWASVVQPHPDVYINLDFPKQGRSQAMNGPHGACGEFDQWCRGYNWGWNLAQDALDRATKRGINPGRYWFDVEVDNYWTNWGPHNAQVVRGALDYFREAQVAVGIYGTYYQWGLITGNYMPPEKLPLWVAGAADREKALARCGVSRWEFAGGEIWMVQYYPQDGFDGNVLCPPAREHAAKVAASQKGWVGRVPRNDSEVEPTRTPPALREPARTPTATAALPSLPELTTAHVAPKEEAKASWMLSELRELLRR